MCGFVGFTAPDGSARSIVDHMLGAIRHRGPDGEGIHVDNGIALGHVRLTIIDPEGGQQPRLDPETGDVLVFNGEIYGHAAEARWLEAQGVMLRDRSDTEVLFQMLRLIGAEATLERLDGMFAFAFRDGQTGRLTLARDRFGEKPLFFATRGDRLALASELGALRRFPALADVGFDRDAIAAYLALDYVPVPQTGFEGIEKLGPGEMAVWAGGRLTRRVWWYPRLPSAGGPAAAPATVEAQADRLGIKLDEAVESRLVADVPVGIFLSGGIDSALIAEAASRLHPGITALTMRFGAADYDETPVATATARHFGLKHVVCDAGRDEIVGAVETLAGRIDEPFADSSIVPTFLLCRAARGSMKVALGGDGGDELFAGYLNFKALPAARPLAMMPRALAPLARALLRAVPGGDGYMSLAFKLDQLMNGWGQATRHQPFLWMTAFAPQEIGPLMAGPPPADPVARIIDQTLALTAPADPVERLQLLFSRLYLADDILTKVDRASMYNGLEVRSPFLARDLADFALSLPVDMKLQGQRTKVVLRHLGRQRLPKVVLEQPKHGFPLPVAGLLRGVLREAVADTLLDRQNPIAPFFHRPVIERLIDEHQTLRRDHRKRLWSLYMLFLCAANTPVQKDLRPAATRATVAGP